MTRWTHRCEQLIAAASSIVPSDRRAEWRAEWTAEVRHHAWRIARRPLPQSHGQSSAPAGAGPRLFVRTLGCLAHAAWLRKEEWRLQMIWQDIRYGLRVLWRRPAFTLLSTLTLALAVGALTAVFSVVYGVLLRPLPLREPDRLVQIWELNPVKGWTDNVVAPANLLDWQARNKTFEDITCYPGGGGHDTWLSRLTQTGAGEPEPIVGVQVCANFFSVLGVEAHLGRTFAPDEDLPGHDVAILSDGFWRRRFGARPEVVGQTIALDGTPRRVIGVMPAGFSFPSPDVDVWLGLGWDRAKLMKTRRAHLLRTVARLRPGVTLEQAQADIQRVASQLSVEYPDTNKTMGAGVSPLRDWIVGDVRHKLLLVLAAVGLVLLIACTNVASLLMVQSIERARELALRTALGAKRGRLVRQLITESLLLSLAGSAAGLLVATWAVRAFVLLNPGDVPRLDEVRVDGAMLLFAMAAGCLTTLLFGLLPAAHAARVDPMHVLRESGRSASASLRSQRTRRLLVGAQVALSVLLVVCAGLLIRSFVRLQQVDPGVSAANVLTFGLSLPDARYPKDEQAVDFYERLIAKLDALPGVRGAGATSRLPLTGASWTGDSAIEGRPDDDYMVEVRHKTVTAGYFATAGLRVREGRGFAATDAAGAPEVVVVNQALARRYFAKDNPIGRRITFAKPVDHASWITIVGVVDDERQDRLNEPVKPEIYQPIRQSAQGRMEVVLRTARDPTTLVAEARRVVRDLDPLLAMERVRTFDDVIATSVAPQRFSMLLMSVFAGAALLLAVIGVYGVVSYSVTQRIPEIGVRLALGATQHQVTSLIIRQALAPVLTGLLCGLAAAMLATRWLSSQLFEVSATDPATFLLVATVLPAAALAASILPARRAQRVDPVVALRSE
jgi:putative ABC transport system permease protein